MSRSFGDKIAKKLGVIAEPEIMEKNLSPQDKFIVIGSDGIFSKFSNEDIMRLIIPYYESNDPKGAVQKVLEEAHDEEVSSIVY